MKSKVAAKKQTVKSLNKLVDSKVGNKLFGKKGVLNNNDKVNYIYSF